MLMHALAASCEELRARTGNPPLWSNHAFWLDSFSSVFCTISDHFNVAHIQEHVHIKCCKYELHSIGRLYNIDD